MKTSTIHWLPAVGFAAVVIGIGTVSAFDAKGAPATKAAKSTNAEPTAATATATAAPFVPPQSVFVWNPSESGFGRDPFFPNSPRNAQWGPPPPPKPVPNRVEPPPITPIVPPVVNTTPPPPPPPKRQVHLDLSGIGGRKTAVINSVTFIKDEVGTVRVADGQVKIRLDEILTDSVKVTIWLTDEQTEQREIPLGGK